MWAAEYYLFHQIRRIPFFRQYRLWKAYTVWRKHISEGRVSRAQSALTREFFLFNPALRECLAHLRRLCNEASEWPLLEVGPALPPRLPARVRAVP